MTGTLKIGLGVVSIAACATLMLVWKSGGSVSSTQGMKINDQPLVSMTSSDPDKMTPNKEFALLTQNSRVSCEDHSQQRTTSMVANVDRSVIGVPFPESPSVEILCTHGKSMQRLDHASGNTMR
jgi:hypothetical protein